MALIELQNEDLINLQTKETIISNINLSVDKGEFILITGINGVGKSTLFKALLDFQGNNEERYAELKNGIYLFCNSPNKKDLNTKVINITQDDYISKPLTRVEKALKEAIPISIKDKELYFKNWLEKYKPLISDDKKKNILKKRIISLSGGEKKYIAILQGLIRCEDPDVKLALIDEPINNLDAKHTIHLSDLCSRIRYFKPDFSIMFITHCHAFPKIDKAYEINNEHLNQIEYQTHNCFGEYDVDGFYQKSMNPKKQIDNSLIQ